MGKASVSNISVSPRFCCRPKSPCYGPFVIVASLFAILPSPTSRFCPLAPILLQQLAPYCLLVLPDRSSTPRLHPVVVLDYLPAWCPMPWIDVITGATVRLWLHVGPQVQWFSLLTAITHPHPQALSGLREPILSVVLGEPAEGFGSLSCTFLLIISLRVWGVIVLGARRGGFFL